MGCGSSQVANDPQTKPKEKEKNKDEFNEAMGKNIPKFYNQPGTVLIETQRQNTPPSEGTNLTVMQPDKADGDQVQRNQKSKAKKIRAVDDKDEEIFENVQKLEGKVQDLDLIRKSFKGHFVFYSLSSEAIDKLAKAMFYSHVQAGHAVFEQGDQASCYFIIDKGEVEVIIDGKTVRVMQNGDSFGEIALLYNAPRSATITAKIDTYFWTLDRRTFRKSIEELVSREYNDNRKFINEVSFFAFMTPEQKDAVARVLISSKFTSGAAIVNEGDRADSFYVIQEGSVKVLKGGKELRKMGPKDSFGEQALYVSSVRGATVIAETEVKCVTLGRENLTQILGDKVQIIVFNNLMRWSFEKSEILKQLTKIQLEKIAQQSKISNYKAGHIIYNNGEPCNKLAIVLEGTLVGSKDKYEKGQAFGDIYLKKDKRDKPLPSEYKMGSDGVLAELSFAALFKIIGGDFETAVKKNEESHEKKIANLPQRADASHIKVEDLIFIKKLGQGQFGWVYLVKHKDIKDKSYALKSVSKASIIDQSLERHIIQEKQVLELVNFPFIMQFVRTFKDDISIYFLVEYIRGMELFDVIREIGLLNKYETQFYVSTMILALEYLHSKGIVYRDLKPENIMVNDKGYMYLIDLGTAKPLSKNGNILTYTIIGTPHYMAPEIILGKGYSFNVDLWSIGVCMYEFLCGGVPYAEDADDPYEIYEEIMNTQLKFPSFCKDRQAKKLIEQLLQKQPEARLGASYASLKAQPWFDDFDWDKLFSKELPPPYIPPANRLISDQEVEKNFGQGRHVVNEIKHEQQAQKIKTKKQPKNPDWDAQF